MRKFLLVIFINTSLFAQLDIEKPKGWFLKDGRNEAVINNLKNIYSENKSIANSLIQEIDNRGSVLYSYTKYDTRLIKGLSPTIILAIVRTNMSDLDELKKHTKENLLKDLGRITNNFSIKYIKDLKIGNKDAFVVHSTFNLPTYNENVRSWAYFFHIKNNLFYQINFSDIESDKCVELFSKIINNL